ncbi:MAG: hypothetical protein EU531_06640 [Promethearchaeota archaeon]|nr:MAG: hypothetical protein EU531_06640 [Candidatus Lokiarchaeota archaeon]
MTKDSEEPYFIIIDENSDFEIWATNGTGTLEDPYIIEGHTIHIPQDYPSYISGIIQISDVTKHFIIQNNRISANIHDINAHIYIYRVNSSFIIRNNTLSGWSRISPADSIHLRYCYIEGKGLICNNTFNDSNLHFYQVKHIDIFNNTFFSETEYSVWHGSNYAWQSSHIIFSGNNFVNTAILTQDVSNLTVQSNIFNHTLHEFHSSISSHYSTNTRYVNNTFINTGLSMGDSDYLSAHIEGNIVNGKPLGVFINQTNMIIDNSTQYGQIKVLSCSHSMISGQMIDNTSISLSIMYCLNTTIFNCSFSNFRTGVYVGSSNATEIIENEFISPIYQDYAIDADYANGLYLKRNIFGEFYTTLLLWYCTDVIEEDNIYL